MIAMLRGVLVQKDFAGVILDVNGVGYRVHMPMTGLDKLPALGDEITLHIHTSVREDALDLFGFRQEADRRLFAKLIGVSGVGPRLGLSILSSMNAQEVVRAVLRGDIGALKSVKGIGKKTAERLILELNDKVTDFDTGSSVIGDSPNGEPSINEMLDDLRSALSNLGYPASKADQTVQAVRGQAAELSFDELLREALKQVRA
ncbi:MAG: Holliday junction branch migration protein RuvA [Myxococcales bacterium]|nr:Holliday junction branch migration protein RuvA [Myxococcales bacterium]